EVDAGLEERPSRSAELNCGPDFGWLIVRLAADLLRLLCSEVEHSAGVVEIATVGEDADLGAVAATGGVFLARLVDAVEVAAPSRDAPNGHADVRAADAD